ncbi:TldD/PmbA family protein [Microlunatus parietis]|uniref:TldD protein n=1 Tax=Microlunatus parietis TaxID=682979 RepID=A0A7Y9I405_9ACTN|nr:TldD/PmbA family protein [Microlunatus parietis]NYE69565.1 TldD protein [Microlunatus parietis]
MPALDQTFTDLPLRAVADAALSRARDLGAEHADVRIERIKQSLRNYRDSKIETAVDDETLGLAVRVVHQGTWGFAAGIVLGTDAAAGLAEQAVRTAQVSRPLTTERVELAPEPVYADATWVSAYELDPFQVADAEKDGRMIELSDRLLAADGVNHAEAQLWYVLENKFYADLAGTTTIQQRVRLQPELTAISVGDHGFASMRTLAAPTGRGWEYLTGTGWDFDAEVAELPELLAAHAKAPSVQAGRYDLVIDPTNLYLTIHESIGHATELDRALGYEAAYAGTSFATVDQLGTLHYGSEVMNVTGDREVDHGLATVGYDDEGVAGQTFPIITEGTLVGYQLNRQMAAARGLRSNGCSFADSPGHIPMQRMPNVSLQPAENGPSTDELIGRVDRGIYIVGDKSWSIDMQRYNFQFTGQRFYAIENGKITHQLRDVAYQATTTDFWRSMEAVGGPQTYYLGGAFNCGKGQPGQIAPVSHGCPSALFRQVNILNTVSEGGQ